MQAGFMFIYLKSYIEFYLNASTAYDYKLLRDIVPRLRSQVKNRSSPLGCRHLKRYI